MSKFCEQNGIAHQGIGPIRFYAGFTSEVIDGTAQSIEDRHEAIKSAVAKISEGKQLVVVDGVGYPAVGSVAGVSNAHVAALLGAPVLLISRAGLGNAIDSTYMNLAFFEKHGAHVLGCVWFARIADRSPR